MDRVHSRININKPIKIAVIPDTQVKPGIDLDYLRWSGEYIADKRPDVIVHLGDHADMPSLSSYDVKKKSFEGRTFRADIDAANEGIEILTKPIKDEISRRKANHKKRWNPLLIMNLGNHENRINRAIEEDRKLEGLISTDNLLYKEYGWDVAPFLHPVIINDVLFSHYVTSGAMGRPIGSARMLITKTHMSCVVGHQQGRDVAYGKKADGNLMTSMIIGSYYEHEESYIDFQSNGHWRGIAILNEVQYGQMDEMFISINYLRNKYLRNKYGG